MIDDVARLLDAYGRRAPTNAEPGDGDVVSLTILHRAPGKWRVTWGEYHGRGLRTHRVDGRSLGEAANRAAQQIEGITR